MIYYFSGTGNTRFAAHSLAEHLHTHATLITHAAAAPEDAEGIMFPIYSWGVPPIILEFAATLKNTSEVWAVATCGDETGDAPAMLRSHLERLGIRLSAFYSIIMPNNYVLLPGFDTDSAEVEESKLQAVPDRLKSIASAIASGNPSDSYTAGKWPRLKTRAVYPLFSRWGIFPERWKASEHCIGCGKCSRVCPLKNIAMRDNRPVWGDRCASCLACYHYCPTHAVAYGNITRHKGQYHFPD